MNLKHSIRTAVLFLVFNRPDTTIQVFNKIRQAKPPRLYVVADGPRRGMNEEEKKKIKKVRKIVEMVDWPCEVKRLFRSKNLGCAKSIIGGLNWFFQNENQGIILEDDVLPSKAFFFHIEKNLDVYKNKKKVWVISGTNILSESKKNPAPCFSLHGTVWGWGTWKDRWKKFKKKVPNYKKLKHYPTSFSEKINFLKIINEVKKDKRSNTNKYWDYYWLINRIENNGLTLIPKYNYAKNIGFFSGNNFSKNKKIPFNYPKISNIYYDPPLIEVKRSINYDKFLWNYKFKLIKKIKVILSFYKIFL